MNCHIVPRVYLKSWRHNDSSIFIFPKDKLYSVGEEKSLSLKETSFAQSNRFILESKDCYFNNAYKNEFLPLFEYCQAYNIELHGNRIQSLEDFIESYGSIKNWVIRDADGSFIDANVFASELEQIWEDKTQKLIESYFNINIENKWNKFLSYVNRYALNCTDTKVHAKSKYVLVEFMATQMSRVFEQVDALGIKQSLQILEDIVFSSDLPESLECILHEVLHGTAFRNELCLLQLYNYVKARVLKKPIEVDNTVSIVLNTLHKMCPILLIADGKSRFITSDNPCYPVTLNSCWPKEFNGIYLPISPEVCAYFVNNHSNLNNYMIIKTDENNVRYINYMTAINCISCVVHTSKTMQDMISETPKLESWKSSLRRIGIAYKLSDD